MTEKKQALSIFKDFQKFNESKALIQTTKSFFFFSFAQYLAFWAGYLANIPLVKIEQLFIFNGGRVHQRSGFTVLRAQVQREEQQLEKPELNSLFGFTDSTSMPVEPWWQVDSWVKSSLTVLTHFAHF